MDNLESQLQRIQAQIAQEKAKGAAERNDAKIAQLEQDEADILAQMDEAKKQEKAAEIEEKVHAETVPFAIEGVDFKQLPAELITVIELVVKADRRRIYGEHALEIEQITNENDHFKRDMDGMIESLRAVNKKLSVENDDMGKDAENLRRQLQDEQQMRQDAEQKRDAAATALAEANQEIDRLKSQIDDYQKAKVFGEREAQNVIDTKPEEAEAINEALKKLYVSVENWGSTNKVVKPDGSFELVKNKDLDEWSPITPPSLGGSESSDSFRGEDTQADAENNQLPATEEAQNVDSFPVPVQNAIDAVGGNAALHEMVGAPTREEFEALKERVSRLEQSKMGAVA